MNVNKDLVIINNEKISKEKTKYNCDNIDVKSIPEDLDKKFSVTLIARNSKDKRMRQINIEKIRSASNIFTFLFSILKTFKKKEAIYLIISVWIISQVFIIAFSYYTTREIIFIQNFNVIAGNIIGQFFGNSLLEEMIFRGILLIQLYLILMLILLIHSDHL